MHVSDEIGPNELDRALVPLDRPAGRTQWTFEHAGRSYAVFEVGEELRVTDGTCPHNGGPLAEGLVRDGVVTCPWHWYSYELDTGRCRTAAGYDAEAVPGGARRRPAARVAARPRADAKLVGDPARARPSGRLRDVTWRQCLNARGTVDPSTAAGARRRARQEGRTFDVLLPEEVTLGFALQQDQPGLSCRCLP